MLARAPSVPVCVVFFFSPYTYMFGLTFVGFGSRPRMLGCGPYEPVFLCGCACIKVFVCVYIYRHTHTYMHMHLHSRETTFMSLCPYA
jgi:hypothetical protein